MSSPGPLLTQDKATLPGTDRPEPRPPSAAFVCGSPTCNLASGSQEPLLCAPAGLGGPGRAGFPSRLFGPWRPDVCPPGGRARRSPQSQCVLNT